MTRPEPAPSDDIAQTLAEDDPRARKRRVVRFVLWLALLLLAGVGVYKWKGDADVPDFRFISQPAKKGDLTVFVTATGNLQPTNQVDVGSELSGIVRSVAADYNDTVVEGQTLAALDPSKLEAQVLQSRASLAGAKAKVLQVQATIRENRNKLERLKRLVKLSDNRAVSQFDLDAAEAALARARADKAAARAEVERANAVLDANETDLAKTIIRSPVNGVVLTRSVEPGQTVAASLQAPVLFTLAEDLTKMELHVDVDEADVGAVRVGQKAEFTVDAYPNRRFPAEITQVRFGAKTESGVVTYETILNADNGDLSLRPGMTATADIVVHEIKDALLVPNAALRFAPPVNHKRTRREGGNILMRLFPRPPREEKARRDEDAAGKTRQKVYALRDGKPVPVSVSIGLTDGVMTEIVDGDVRDGTPLVVDAESVKK